MVLISKSEVTILKLGSNDSKVSLSETTSLAFKEVDNEVHQIAITPTDGSHLMLVILHDEYQLTKLVLNTSEMKFHQKVYSFSLLQ